MTDDAKHKIGDRPAHQSDASQKLDNPETKELVNAGGTAMQNFESKRTNASSGSFDASQEMSIEIDFGNGQRESRHSRGAADIKTGLDKNGEGEKEKLKSETLGAFSPLLKIADVSAYPVIEQQAPLRLADSAAKENSELSLAAKDKLAGKFDIATHDKDGFVKDPIGYGLMLAQLERAETIRRDVPAPSAPIPHLLKPDVAPAPQPTPFPLPVPRPIDYKEQSRKLMEQVAERQKEEKSANELLSLSRTKLEANVRAVIKNPVESTQFLADMRTFEVDYLKRSPLENAKALVEIAETYKHVDRLLTATSDAIPVTKESTQKPGDTPWRVLIAEQIMHHAADPTSINQGPLAVCPTSALQVRLYYRDPSSVASLITDMTLSGHYRARTGDKKYEEPANSKNLVPDSYARAYKISSDIDGTPMIVFGERYLGPRSFASQVFDVTAINMAMSGKELGKENHFQFFQPTQSEIDAHINAKEKAQVQGIVISNTGKVRTWRKAMDDNLSPTDDDLVKLNRWITGKSERGFVVCAGGLTQPEAQQPWLRELSDFGNLSRSVSLLYRPEDLPQLLLKLREENLWPPIVSLDLSTPPFNVVGGGAHSMVITDISPDGQFLSYDSTWGKPLDRTGLLSIKTSDIAKSVLLPTSNTFDFVFQNRAAISQLSDSKSRAEWKKQLSIMSNTIGAHKLDLKNSDHSKFYNGTTVQYWLKSNPWDKSLDEWKAAVDDLLDKYP